MRMFYKIILYAVLMKLTSQRTLCSTEKYSIWVKNANFGCALKVPERIHQNKTFIALRFIDP